MRTASLSLKQAIGILVLEVAALFLFADASVFFISILELIFKAQKFQGLPSIIGLFIGALIVLIFVVFIALLGIGLVRDKRGMEWKKVGKV